MGIHFSFLQTASLGHMFVDWSKDGFDLRLSWRELELFFKEYADVSEFFFKRQTIGL